MAVTIVNQSAPQSRRVQSPAHPEITTDKMEVFGRLRFTNAQIGAWYNLTAMQIATVLRRAEMRAAYDRGRAEVGVAIRQKQLELALAGNVQLLIHAGIHFADQSKDGPVEEPDDHNPGRFSWDVQMKELLDDTRRKVLGQTEDQSE